jgi:hypothetical protein
MPRNKEKKPEALAKSREMPLSQRLQHDGKHAVVHSCAHVRLSFVFEPALFFVTVVLAQPLPKRSNCRRLSAGSG